jgi:DNA primase
MSVVDEIKQKIDIVDFIGSYVQLKKAGHNFKGLCPFHNEKTPSFIVFPDQGTWHCFGACGTGGDIFTFLMRRENIDFGQALELLGQRAGVQLVHEKPGEDEERKRLREILATAAAHYHYLLKNNPASRIARDYLAHRHVSPDSIEQFELGLALNEWEAMKSFLVGKGFAVKDIEAAGLAIPGESGTHYDRFRGRLMFPIRNRNGEVIGFGARALSYEEPKYLNSPQTLLFDKSATLYGLDHAKEAIRSENLAVIVEGYMDVIGAHQGGFKNVVASLGTALTEKQLGLIKRLTNRYALALDPDAAGEEATRRGLEVAREALDHRSVPVPMGPGLIKFEKRLEAELLVIPLPEGMDPDEIITDDPAHWSHLVENAEPLVDFYFRVLTQDLDLDKARDKSIAVKRLAPIIHEIGDAVQQVHYIQILARLVHTPERLIEEQVGRLVSQKGRTQLPPTPQIEESRVRADSKLEDYFLMLAINSPEYLPRLNFLDEEDFLDVEHRALYVAIRDQDKEPAPDLDAFRASLDESLQPLFDTLAQGAQQLAQLGELDLAREIESTAYRLRMNRDKSELNQVEFLLRDRESEPDFEEESLLHERAELLRRRVAENHKALSARTMYKTFFPSYSGTM